MGGQDKSLMNGNLAWRLRRLLSLVGYRDHGKRIALAQGQAAPTRSTLLESFPKLPSPHALAARLK